jgi:hypothetical protein
MSKNGNRGQSAWLVTWRSFDDDSKQGQIAAILSPRLGGERVREFVELLYLAEYSTTSDKIAYMSGTAEDPYPATFGQTLDYHPWHGQISCGHHPFLFARIVDDLKIEQDADGNERATWKERPKPLPKEPVHA